MMGTAHFMAPEQILSNLVATVSAKSDVYGFGGVMVHTLSGRYPWNDFAKQPYVVVNEVANRKQPPPELQMLSENKSVFNFVSQCLTFDPDLRPTPTEVVQFCEQQLAAAEEAFCELQRVSLEEKTLERLKSILEAQQLRFDRIEAGLSLINDNAAVSASDRLARVFTALVDKDRASSVDSH